VLILDPHDERRDPAVARPVIELERELGQLDPRLGLDLLGRCATGT